MTTRPLTIIGIVGSLRSASYSRMVQDSIADMLPPDCRFDSLPIGDFPHYNEDLEKTALPTSVSAGRQRVQDADAVIIITPEFNHGLPGVLKNCLDWLSRPAFQSCLMGKPVMFATLSPGALGGVRAQYQLRETLASMLCHMVPLPEIAITHVGAKVQDGRLSDAATLAFIRDLLGRFLAALPQS